MKTVNHIYIRTILAALLMFVAGRSIHAENVEVEIDGVYYDLNSETKEAKLYNGESIANGDVVIPDAVIYNEITYNVTSLGIGAFRNCKSLTSITIPNSVTTIGHSCFMGCTSLVQVHLPNSIELIDGLAFSSCENLSNIIFPDGLIRFGSNVFSGTKWLDNQPNGIVYAGNNVYYCKGDGIINLSLREGTLSIAKDAFGYQTKLRSIRIPNSVRFIDEASFDFRSTFYDWGNFVESITVDEGNLYYDSRNNCNAIIETASNKLILGCKNTVIPNDEEIIMGRTAFHACRNLTSLTIPANVKRSKKDDEPFNGCRELKEITLLCDDYWKIEDCDNLTAVKTKKLHYTYGYFNDYIQALNVADLFGSQLQSFTILDGGTNFVTQDMMQGCYNLNYINLPKNLINIEEDAFSSCRNLERVELNCLFNKPLSSIFGNRIKTFILGDEIHYVDNNTFSGCTYLESIYLGQSITYLSSGTFADCGNLKYVFLNNAFVSNDKTSTWSLDNIFGTQVQMYIIPDGTTTIGAYAFKGCSGLTSIDIPESVTFMGSNAFSGCSSLASITIPNSVTAIEKECFSDCSSLKSIIIPQSVNSIEEKAFYGCSSLKSVTIPSSVAKIGTGAFADCSNLESVTINSNEIINNGNYMSNIFGGQVLNYIIGNDVTHIGVGSFQRCDKMTSVILGEKITSIGENAFFGCSGLIGIAIPNSVKSIGGNAFSDCLNLDRVVISSIKDWCEISFANKYANPLSQSHKLYETKDTVVTESGSWGEETYTRRVYNIINNIEIPNNVAKINNYAFSGLNDLTTVTIPESVTSIGIDAFSDCNNLKTVKINSNDILNSGRKMSDLFGQQVCKYNIGNNIKVIGNDAFSGCYNIESLIIPENVKSLGQNAFSDCHKLKSISIPESMTKIGKQAFNGCRGLTKVIIPSIDAWCNISFDDDSSNPLSYAHHLHIDNDTEITDLVIPEGVENVNDYAFYGGSNLKSVTIPSSLKTIGTGAFNGCEALSKVIVPDILSWCNIHFGDNPLWDASHLYSDSETEITDLTIPYGVNKINSGTFKNASSIMSINLPNSLTEIGGDAFYGCSNLKSLTLPNGIEKIGSYAFYKCSSLEKLVIPNSVKSIDSYAFGNCLNLYSVTSLINLPFKLNESAFSYSGTDYSTDVIYLNATLYVPRGKLAMYMLTEGWQKFINVMETDTKFILTYVLDGEVYKTYEIQAAEVITPEPDPYKAGYIFSGWSEIPYLMPAQNVTVTGNFTVDPNSGIEGVSKDETISKDIYTIDGLRTNNVKRGLNIIRMNNGTTRKVMVK